MKKRKAKTIEISFHSKKCRKNLTVIGQEAREVAEWLEMDSSVLSYDSKIPFTADSPEIQKTRIRPSYFKAEWISDFMVERTDGKQFVLEVVKRENLKKKAEVEKLELSRRYWNNKDIQWYIAIV